MARQRGMEVQPAATEATRTDGELAPNDTNRHDGEDANRKLAVELRIELEGHLWSRTSEQGSSPKVLQGVHAALHTFAHGTCDELKRTDWRRYHGEQTIGEWLHAVRDVLSDFKRGVPLPSLAAPIGDETIRSLRSRLKRILDGALSPDERRRFQLHMARVNQLYCGPLPGALKLSHWPSYCKPREKQLVIGVITEAVERHEKEQRESTTGKRQRELTEFYPVRRAPTGLEHVGERVPFLERNNHLRECEQQERAAKRMAKAATPDVPDRALELASQVSGVSVGSLLHDPRLMGWRMCGKHMAKATPAPSLVLELACHVNGVSVEALMRDPRLVGPAQHTAPRELVQLRQYAEAEARSM